MTDKLRWEPTPFRQHKSDEIADTPRNDVKSVGRFRIKPVGRLSLALFLNAEQVTAGGRGPLESQAEYLKSLAERML